MPEQPLKKCSHPDHEGDPWLPANTKYFYPTTSRGKRTNQWGEPYLRSICRLCKLRQHREWSKTKRPKRTEEEKERYAKMQRARRRAYQRLAAMNEEGFKLLYGEELAKEGLQLEHYVGPVIRRETDQVKLGRVNNDPGDVV